MARYTTKLEAAEPSQLGSAAVSRLGIDYNVVYIIVFVGGCRVQVYEFKPHAGTMFFFSLLLFAINKAYPVLLINPRNRISNIIMIFNINSTRGQTRFLTCIARVTCLPGVVIIIL